MITRFKRTTMAAALTLGAALALSACSSAPAESNTPETPAETNTTESYYPITITDLAGNEVEIESADSVVITDNRLFQIAYDWGIELSAAPRTLMSENNPYKADESILDTGSHREPDLEAIVNAAPDLIINGQRYQGHADDIKAQAPDAAFVDTTNDELSTQEFIEQSVEMMGEIFNKEDEAAALIADLNAAIDEAKAAYNPETTVMGLIASGNEIRYSSATEGRGVSDFFSLIGMTPALDEAGSANHQGDDISIEAIAEANADFFLVLDRDAATAAEGEWTPAMELITGSSALANVPAVQNQAIYVMPNDYYLTEDVHAHTAVLRGLAAAFAG